MALFDFFKINKGEKKENQTEELLKQETISEVTQEDLQQEPIQEELIEEVAKEELKQEPSEVLLQEEVEEEQVQIENLQEPLQETSEPIHEEVSDNIQVEVTETPVEEKTNFFKRIISGLDKTRKSITTGIENVLSNFKTIDEELFEELEEALIMADLGVETSIAIINTVRERVKKENITEVSEIKNLIVEEISNILDGNNEEFDLPSPSVVLVIGVNGVGKTTTIGKLTSYYKSEGKKVLLAAGDTFRAAAIDQLEVWGKRSGVEIIKHQENSDPSAVIFDAIQSSKAKKVDILICDTAGRLHNKKNLMEELRKIFRIVSTNYQEAKLEVLLVLDATTGQNALQQAKLFKEVADITGIVLTKLDGTAKGGVVISIKNELKIPVRFIGVGEAISDLRPFKSKEFAVALFNEGI